MYYDQRPEPCSSGYSRSESSSNNNAKIREITDEDGDDEGKTEEEKSMYRFARFLEKRGFIKLGGGVNEPEIGDKTNPQSGENKDKVTKRNKNSGAGKLKNVQV